MTKPKFRRPEAEEQHVLEHLTVRPIRAAGRKRYDELMKERHYLRTHQLVGEQLCYVATFGGQWLALSSWSAAAWHLKGRDQFIGWSAEQCRRRRALLANNARFLILPEHHLPNLASRVMKLVLQQLSDDWQERFKHPIALVESFVDPEQFRGTTYQCSGWSQLGLTQGYGRQARDYYVQHDQPKQLWVKALVKNAPARLRSERLPESWAGVESKIKPRCTARSAERKESDGPSGANPGVSLAPRFRLSPGRTARPHRGGDLLRDRARQERSGALRFDSFPTPDAGLALPATGPEVP